jgi:predicted transposase YdaD
MLARKHPELKEAVSCVKRMSLREQWQWAMLDYQMWKWDQQAEKEQLQIDLAEARAVARTEGLAEGKAEGLAEGLAEGKAEGKAEGIAEGTAESKLEIARKMKKAGRPFSEIVEFTGLSPEAVQD